MTEQRKLADTINQARESGQLVYAWPQRFSGRYLVYAAKCSGRRLRVQLASGVWTTVDSADVEFMPSVSVVTV